MRVFFFIITSCIALAVLATPASAFEVRPAIQEVQIVAGAGIDRVIELTNTKDEPIELFFTVQKFRAGGGGAPTFLPPEDIEGLPEWIRVSAPKIQLPPRSSKSVRVRIDVPKEASAGGYAAAVFVTERPEKDNPVAIMTRIATLWLVTVQSADGTLPRPAWKVESFAARALLHGLDSEIQTKINIHNTGNAHGMAVTTLQYEGFFLKATSTIEIMRLLPDESREKVSTLPISSWIDRVKVVVKPPTGRDIEQVVWVISPVIFILGLGSVSICAGLFWRWRKRRNRGILAS